MHAFMCMHMRIRLCVNECVLLVLVCVCTMSLYTTVLALLLRKGQVSPQP